MRAFIAIKLPKEIQDALSRLQEQLKASGADVKWVTPQNIHLTLKFLGDIDDTQKEKIIRIIADIAKDTNSFQAGISSIGAFPKINFPRVIWIGIDKGDDEIKAIAKALEEEIQKTGIPKEDRPFSSHITIGRTKSSINRERLVQELNKVSASYSGGWEFGVTQITLYKSILTPKGPIYEVLNDANLKTT